MSFLYGCPDNCIRTFTGNIIDILDPNPGKFIIEDIAHSLSNICRFGGHTPKYYSVAEHCLNCMHMAKDNFKRDLLFHDSSEAYLHDIMRPVKQHLTGYKALEEMYMTRLSEKFGFTYPLAPEVAEIDNRLLQIEFDIIMRGEVRDIKFAHHSPEVAEKLFLTAYYLF